MNRQCVATGACYEPFGDCDTEFGCETLLQTPEHCGACGRDCGATNAAPECSSLTTCANPTCNAGYGNCDRASLDCEATYGAACFPDYAGTRRIALGPIAAAVATGGSFTVGGNFTGEVDFDPSLGVDRLYSVYEADAYVTRHDANGAYAWTRAVASGYGYESVTGLSMTPDGSTIATGVLSGPADLDPGPAVDEHSVYGVFVSKLSPAGIRDWARVIGGVNLQVSQLSTDAAGAVYVSGWFAGQVDLDPGPGQDLHEASALNESGFLVKLDASGNFVWSKLVEGEHGGQRWLGVSVAPDGSVWGLGSQVGSATIGETTLSATRGFFLAAFEASGAFRRAVNFDVTAGAWLPASIAAGAGAIHFNAISWGEDLDPGAGRVFRYGEGPNAVLVTLDDTAAYRDAHLYPAYSYLPELATTSGGGALLGLPDGELRAYYTDGVSSWTLAVGDTFTLNLLASSSTHFIVVGNEYGTADYDPGAGTDAVYPGTLLVTRYAF
jgi:hypothetical protein